MGQTTQGLANSGRTAHYQISFDTSLSIADGLQNAQALMDACERDFDLMQGWFAGVNFQFSFPIGVQINNASGGASWNDPPNIVLPFGYSPTVQLNPGPGASVVFLRYLLVSEVTEMFMASKDNEWFESTSLFSGADEGTKGESLSRFLGFQFKLANGLQNVRFRDFEVVPIWLNSPIELGLPARPLNVDTNLDDEEPDVVTGCGTCFLYFLHNQLGFAITDIINAGADTLAGVFTKLTGRTGAWQEFSSLVNLHYPPDRAYDPTTGDNIFPVPNLANLDNDSIRSGATQNDRILSLDTQAPAAIVVSMTSENPAVLTVPAQIGFNPGDWAEAVTLQAAPITGPTQAVTIHATYAGQTLGATVNVTPRPSIIEGQVRDTSMNGIVGASVVIGSDTVVVPGLGNSLQLTTDANGFYQTPAIPPGVYQVSATASSYVPQSFTVTVAEGVPITRQDFVLVAAMAFTITGQVTSISGAPLGGATITLDQNSAIPGRIQIATDASGDYSIMMNPGSYNGSYTVTASDAGYQSNSVTITIPNGATIVENFVLAALGALTGLVLDASTTPMMPVQGAVVLVGNLQAFSDGTGRYTLTGLNPGPLDVTLRAAGFDPTNVTVTIVSGVTTTQNFVLMSGSAVMSGTVTDGDTGDPLLATVSAGTVSTQTADDGSYSLSTIPAGQLQVSVSARGYQIENTLVQFIAHQSVHMDFQLTSRHRRGGGQQQVRKARAGK
jgi:hypothetical protein